MAESWQVNKNGHQYGPYTSKQLVEMAKSGQLAPSDLVWKPGMGEWKPAQTVRGLFAPPPLPPQEMMPVEISAAHFQDDLKKKKTGTKRKWIALSLASFFICCLIPCGFVGRSHKSKENKLAQASPGFASPKVGVEDNPQKTDQDIYKERDSESSAVAKKHKWGFINTTGKLVIDFHFDDAVDFSQGLAAVQKAGRWGFVDKTGKIKIDFMFDKISSDDFKNGVFRVCKGEEWFFINLDGKRVPPPRGLYHIIVGEKVGFMDETGQIIINPQFDAASDFVDGRAIVVAGKQSGIIDESGHFVMPLQSRVFVRGLPWNFQDELAAFRDNEGQVEGYLDRNGKVAIPANYELATKFSEGLACVQKWAHLRLIQRNPGLLDDPQLGKTGYIDKGGKYVIPPQFDDGRAFSEGLAAVKIGKDDGKWGFIDKTGKFVINPKYDDADDFMSGMASVKVDGKYGYIDRQGVMIISPRFASVSKFSDGLARVKSD